MTAAPMQNPPPRSALSPKSGKKRALCPSLPLWIGFVFLLSAGSFAAGESFAAEGAPSPAPLASSFSGAAAASLKDDFSFLSNPALLAFQTRPGWLAAYKLSDKGPAGLLAAQDLSAGLPAGIFLSKTFKTRRKGKEGSGDKAKDKGLPLEWGAVLAQKTGCCFSFGGAFQKAALFSARFGLGFKAGRRTAVGLSFGSLFFPFGESAASSSQQEKSRILSVGAYQGFGTRWNGRADADFNLKTRGWALKGGAEGRLFEFLLLRAGGRCDFKPNSCSQSFGVGLAGRRLQMDYGVSGAFRRRLLKRERFRLRKGGGTGTSHVLSAKLSF